jgi:predicted nucleotidyltransferase
MGVLGIIAEYNPFHNGHLYHLNDSKALTKAEYVICVMSGNFVQRGEPAIIGKWARAETALRCGVDLVVELPVVYALSSAEFFAYGGVKLLNSLGVVDYLSFGSEDGRIDILDSIADILLNEPPEFRNMLLDSLDSGKSFAAAREESLIGYLGNEQESIISEAMKGSNNILAIEYLKSLKKTGSSIKPVTIPRKGSLYNAEMLEGSFSSATAIRKRLHENPDDLENIETAVPKESADILKREVKEGRGPVFPEDFEKIIISRLRQMSVEEISKLPYVSEGLENRIKSAAEISADLEQLVGNIATRRYPRTRIFRILFHLLTGLDRDTFERFQSSGGPQYIRVLGFNSKGRQLLSRIKTTASLPVIVKASDYKIPGSGKISGPMISTMLNLEAAATDQYVLSFKNPAFQTAGQEFTNEIVRV